MENSKQKPSKNYTKAAGIINIVYPAIDLLITLIAVIFVNDLLAMLGLGEMAGEPGEVAEAFTQNILLVLTSMVLAFDVLLIILASIMLKRTSKPISEYKMGVPIALFVLDCILVVFAIINAQFVPALIYGMCAVFIMIDVVKMKKLRDQAEEQGNIQTDGATNQNAYSNDYAQPNYNSSSNAQQSSTTSQSSSVDEAMIAKIQKLDKMKAIGVINDAEYEKMKEQIIKDSLK